MEAKSSDYIRLLRRFSKPVLIEAYDEVLRDWHRTQWPPPGAFYTAASRIRARDRKPPEHLPAPDWGERLGLPHDKVMNILDELGPRDPGLRRMLYRLGTGGQDMPARSGESVEPQSPLGSALAESVTPDRPE